MRRTSSPLSSHESLGAALQAPLRRRCDLIRTRLFLGGALVLVAGATTVARGEEPKPRDPFTQAATAATSGATGSNPFRTGGGTAPAAAATPKGRADQLLLDARRALSVGDLARAQQFLAQAQQLGVAYEGPGDSPLKVAESIATGQELAELRKTSKGGEVWRQSYAKFLVVQADALLGWGDLDMAARTASEAGQLYPTYAANGTTPTSLLKRIAERRKAASATPAGATTAVAATTPATPAAPAAMSEAKAKTVSLLTAAREALAEGNLAIAEHLAGEASALNVPESQFADTEDRPSRLAADVLRARGETETTQLATVELPQTSTPGADNYAQAAATIDLGAPLEVAELPAATPLPAPTGNTLPGGGDPFALLEAGEQALKSGDRAGALEKFRAAYQLRAGLDVLMQQRLQGHLQMLSTASTSGGESIAAPEGEMLDAAAAGQTVVARQLSADIGKRQSEATKMREADPVGSLRLLREARGMVETASIDDAVKRQLLSRLDMSVADTEKYINDHKAELELNAANKEILDEIERERVVKIEVQGRVAEMVDQFNGLIDEHRYAEAEVIANRLYEMAPEELVAQQVMLQAKMVRRNALSREIIADTENAVANNFLDTRLTAQRALEGSTTDFAFGDDWDQFKNRKAINNDRSREIIELEIEQKLKTKVQPAYDEQPLTKVIESLSQVAGINIHLDPRGLEQEGVRSDTPVTFNLPNEISLKSALQLILEPLHLTYMIKDEVLKITSEQIRDGDLKIVTYSVGDLVIPIPNFVPNNNMGLQGLINDAYAAIGLAKSSAPGPLAIANADPRGTTGPMPPGVMANPFGGAAAPGANPGFPTGSMGPGGLGGAASADFDSLIDLITSTVDNESWQENGTGEGEIMPFPTNLSLVISQTQRVHEQIADLLEQLRRLQDLQVTIEVRFIRLTDSFFERIGVDFDFNIEDGTGISTNVNVPNSLPPGAVFEPPRASATVGLDPGGVFPNYTVDLDLPFRQGSFGLATPQFGTFQGGEGATFGFSILSDIEAFFLIEASQGDRRANVLQAPKVTLFNGQQAQVIDASLVPFVISVIPVVGDFAAAQQPVIVVLSEGTMMSVQAVVSDDRRYVRLTLVPFFSQIGEVRTFTFEGSETARNVTASVDDDEDGKDEANDDEIEISRSGTTVQLPTFQVISVSTTVSVPDGGTVLLGGIKRLREGRNEFGVPLLSKVPYVDRLFRNVAIGRETDSLMMMVTPHIIIQEEEEERLGIAQE
jgi:general secretion pathway protein D